MKNIEKYFTERTFTWSKSAPLLALESTTVPFCISGGVPYEGILAGEQIPRDRRIASMQTCVRTAKLNSVGFTGRHHICFEMLGHFMFGAKSSQQTKEEMITIAFEFLLEQGLSAKHIAATVDMEDEESAMIWNNLSVKTFSLPQKKVVEARGNYSGYQTEILYQVGQGTNIDSYRELWNIVIYQFSKPTFTGFLPLAYADSGASWDRIVSAKEGVQSNYCNSLWEGYLQTCNFSPHDSSQCRIAEFAKAVVYLVSEPNFTPNNKGAGYELRKLIRQMFMLCQQCNISWEEIIYITGMYFMLSPAYDIVSQEIVRFSSSLLQGYKLCLKNKEPYSETLAYTMYDRHGFPIELFRELKEKGEISWIQNLQR